MFRTCLLRGIGLVAALVVALAIAGIAVAEPPVAERLAAFGRGRGAGGGI